MSLAWSGKASLGGDSNKCLHSNIHGAVSLTGTGKCKNPSYVQRAGVTKLVTVLKALDGWMDGLCDVGKAK